MISFKTTPKEFDTIAAIVDRAVTIAPERLDRRTLLMDLTACHANGNPLDLEELLDAKAFDFFHDVFGITQHINRDTGKLENCFNPRYSRRVTA